MKQILIAAGIAAVTSVGVQAADLGARPYTKATPAVVAVYDWTGFYVGGNVGYGWGENTDPGLSLVNPGNDGGITTFLTTGFPGFSSGNQFPNLHPDGVLGGLQIGYDRQFGSWVLGAVADIQAADFKDSRTIFTSFAATAADTTERLSAKITWFGTVRAKAGVAMGIGWPTARVVWPMAMPIAALALPVRPEVPAAPTSRSRAIIQRSGSAGARVPASRRCSRVTGTSVSNISTLILAARL